MPLRLTRPGVGRKLTTSFQAPGRRMDANVSSPIATVEKFAVVAHPEPPDEPPTVRSRSYGLREAPNIEPKVSPAAYSLNVVLPRMIAPAFFSRSITNASRVGRESLNTSVPNVGGIPAVSISPFAKMG